MSTYRTTPLILIVDDVAQNLQVLGTLLRRIKCEISAANNGKQAIEIARNSRPDLILLDLMMPGMDGYETCEILKNDPDTMDIPVIFLTARNETEDVVKGFKKGAVDYVIKPFNGVELITRVETHLALKKTRDELASALKTKNKFFNIIAHDLKNPLGTILGFSDLLTNSDVNHDPETQKQYVEYIFKSAKSASDLLGNLLDWSRIQTGKLHAKPEIFQVSELLESTVDLLRPTADKKDIIIELLAPDGLSAFGDIQMISTVVRNLGSNALKFTHPGGWVRFGAEADESEEQIRFSVEDEGVGISPENLEKLFTLEDKISTRGTAEEEGTGLGLMLCKEFVQMNRGNLTAESQLGQGSRFVFTIPTGSWSDEQNENPAES